MKSKIMNLFFLFLIIIIIHLLTLYKRIEGFKIRYTDTMIRNNIDNIINNTNVQLTIIEDNLNNISNTLTSS